MMMFIQRICMALRGLGSCMVVERVMRVKAAMLLKHKHKTYRGFIMSRWKEKVSYMSE